MSLRYQNVSHQFNLVVCVRLRGSVVDASNYSEDFESESSLHQTSASLPRGSSILKSRAQSSSSHDNVHVHQQQARHPANHTQIISSKAGSAAAKDAPSQVRAEIDTSEEMFELQRWMPDLPEAMLKDDATRQTLALIHKSIKVGTPFAICLA